jgi:DNA replication protein DnaC
MLTHPILEKLQLMKFYGMLTALEEQMQMADISKLSFEDRLALLVDREMTARENRRLKTRLRKAKLRQNACIEDIDFRHPRGLDKTLFMQLADCRYLKEHNNVLIIGPTGVGKTYLACALAQNACRKGYTALYFRLPRLLHELSIAKADGRYSKLLTSIARTDLLVLDDWGLSKFIKEQRHDLLEILEDRNGLRSTLVTSQLPVKHWHEVIADPTLADAILDRFVHNAYKLNLKGDSMRKKLSKLT